MRYIRILACLIPLFTTFSGISFTQSFQFRHLNIEDGLSQSSVLCMMQDSKGFMWFGTQDGLNRYDGYHFKVYRANPDDTNSISHNWIWDIFEDNDRNIWFATWRGLTKYNPRTKRFSRFLPDTANPYSIKGSRPTSVCQDKDGNLWVGTWGGGLNKYNPKTGKFTCFRQHATEKLCLPDNFVRDVYYDRQGRLWVGTWNGLAQAQVREDRSGLVWVGAGGLNILDPRVESFRVFNREVYFDKDLNEMEKIVLSYKQNFFSFEFAALDYAQPARIQYTYKMKGVDKNWVVSGKRRYASYTNIGPGEYVFQVRGTNSDGLWSKNTKSIMMTISPPYWQTWWFKLTGILIVLMVLYVLHHIRVQKLLAIERLRVRIASDLHDDIGSALTRISITSEQMQTTSDHGKIHTFSKTIGDISRDIISTMSDIIWSIDARNDTLTELVDRMHDFTHNAFAMGNIKVGFVQKGMEKKKKIPVNYRQNIFYIYKEVINNIVKHSEATEVKIKLLNQDSHFVMELSDNGKGFDPEKVLGGNGLRNIRMRAGRLKADINITVDKGVTVTLKMKKL